MFFFEKKNQKTFAPLRACVTPAVVTSKNQSFFAAFCSQKAGLSHSLMSFLPSARNGENDPIKPGHDDCGAP